MGEHIVARAVQTKRDHLYEPGSGSCSCGSCSIFSTLKNCHKSDNISDWEVGKVDCCGGFCLPQPQCVPPDREECNIGFSSKGLDPILSFGWDKKAPNLKCTYNFDAIDTRSQLTAFEEKFGENNDVISKYCTQKVTTCPEGMSECSRLKSTGDGGDYCRSWFEEQAPHVKDATMQNYCSHHNTDDCKCVNRTENKSYSVMKGAHVINDGCWYLPCANKSSKYMVPTDLVNPKGCPTNICDVLFNIVDDGNINIDDVKNDIVCYGKSDPINSNPPNSNPPNPESQTFFQRYKFEIASLLVIIMLFIIIIYRS